MKRVLDRLVVVSFVVVAVLFVLFFLWNSLGGSNTPPQITCDSEVFSVSIHDGEEALLSGVHATDEEDGDITDRVVVENVSHFSERGVSHVTYAVQDSQNTVTKLIRTVQYSDYTPPRFSLKQPLVFSYGKSINPVDYVTVEDCLDGDLTDKVRMSLLEDETTISGVGTWQVRFRVTNSMGDTVYLTTEVTVTDIGSNEKYYTPEIQLSDYLVYVPVGSNFSPLSYVRGVSVSAGNTADDPAQLQREIRYESNVDTSTPGVYKVTYTSVSSRYYVGTADMLVVVGDLSS